MKTNPLFIVAVIALITAIFSLTACQSPPEKQFPLSTWEHQDIIVFNLGALEIDTKATPKIDPPYVGYLFPLSPLDAARNWGNQRLAVNGDNNLLRYTILEATAIETALEVDQSLEKYFTDEQSERYDVRIVVELSIINEKKINQEHGILARVRAHANQSRTVPQGIKLAEREQIWFEMVETAMNTLNSHLEKEIRSKLAKYVSEN